MHVSPFSACAPQHPCQSGGMSTSATLWRGGEQKKWLCVCLLHFCTRSGKRNFKAWCGRRKKLMLVLASARGCGHSIDFRLDSRLNCFSWVSLLLLPSFHPSLLWHSPLITARKWTFSSFSHNAWSNVYRKQFLDIFTVALFCVVSLDEETQDLAECKTLHLVPIWHTVWTPTLPATVVWIRSCRTFGASLELLREEIRCLQPHKQLAVQEGVLLITITEC